MSLDRHDTRPLRALLAGIGLAGLAVAYAAVSTLRGYGADAAVAVGLIIVIAFVLAVPFFVERRIDVFSPIVFYMLMKTQWLGKPLIELLRGEYQNSQLINIDETRAFALLNQALGVLLVAQIAYLVGYYSGFHRALWIPSSGIASRLDLRKLRWISLGIAGVLASSIALVVHFAGGFVEMWDKIGMRRELYADMRYLLMPLDFLPQLALIFFALSFGRRPSMPWPVVAALVALCVLLAGTGDRSRIVSLVITLLVFSNYYYKRVSLARLTMVGTILVVVALAIQDLRRSTFGGDGIDFAVLDSEHFRSAGFLEEFFVRRRSIDLLAVLLYLMPDQLPFQLGSTFLNIIFLPVPRSVWPQKPIIDESGIVGNALMGDAYYGLPVGTEGVFFMNFHLFGVLAGMCLFGAWHRRIYQELEESRERPAAIVIYAMLIYNLMFFTVMNIVNTIVILLPTWMALRLAAGPRAPLAAPAGAVLDGRAAAHGAT